MTNSFKKLKSSAKVPESLKPRVMQSLNMAGVVFEIVELFTINYISTLEKLFSTGTMFEGTENEEDVT